MTLDGQMSIFDTEYIKPPKPMRVLVACEESQRVCIAFREKGHEAYSCDIIDCSGGHPEWHILGDCLAVVNGNCVFITQDGILHKISEKWDLIIAHPPCTRLTVAANKYYKPEYASRFPNINQEREEAIKFFMEFTDLCCDKIAIENPVGIMSTCYRKPDQIYNPYDFEGETECKKTCLWLKGLEPLKATQVLSKEQRTQGIWKAHFDGKQYSWSDPETAKLRSKTPIGVAKAMAEQWG